MSRYLLFLIIALFSSMAMPAAADEGHAALVKSTTGTVTVTRQQHLLEVTSGTTLQVSDRIVTAADSSVAIVFRDGTLLTLGSGADVLVRDYVFEPKAGEYSFSMYLAKGSAIYESGKIGKVAPQSVKVETPTATVGVRGTRFLIDAN